MAGISAKAAGKIENKKKFVSQDFDDELGWNSYQFRFRTHDPQIGRFLQIDPLSNQYVHNSTYTYAENRVINGIDLEGLEFVETISKENCTKEWEITLKVINRSNDSKEQIEKAANSVKENVEKVFKGQDSDGFKISTTVKLEFTELDKVHYNEDLILEFNNGTFRNKESYKEQDVAGMAKVGQTENGIIEVVAPSVFGSEKKSRTESETISMSGLTGAHEVGHSGGLLHINDPNAPKSIRESYKVPETRDAFNFNLMHKALFTNHIPMLLPAQLTMISNSITNKKSND